MIFSEQTYSVLIVSANEKFNNAITPMLPPSQFWPIKTVPDIGEARRTAFDQVYDIVLINTPLKEEFGTKLASDICAEGSSAVMLFVRNDIYDDIYSRVVHDGIMVIPKPTSSQMAQQALRMMCAFRERLKDMEARQVSVEDKIKEIRLINKAKWLLIDRMNMSEADAHRYIEKNAMDKRISRTEVAHSIIIKYSEETDLS